MERGVAGRTLLTLLLIVPHSILVPELCQAHLLLLLPTWDGLDRQYHRIRPVSLTFVEPSSVLFICSSVAIVDRSAHVQVWKKSLIF